MAKIILNKSISAPDAPSTNKICLYPVGNDIFLKREDGSTVKLNIDGNTTTNLAEGSNLYHTNARVDARIAAISKTQQEVNSTDTSTTTSSSLVDMNSMTLTATAAGTALIMFGASVTSSHSNRDITISISVAGSPITSTRRYTRIASESTAQTMSVHTVRTLAVNDIVKIQWSVSGSTGSVYERTLSIIYL